MGVSALRENLAAFGVPRGTGFAQDLGEFLAGKPRKHRQIGHQRTVDRGHVSSAIAFSSEVGSREENA